MDLIFSYESDNESGQDDIDNENQSIDQTIKTNKQIGEVDLPELPCELFSDEIEKHVDSQKGKKRQFEHVEGNYPTYVYVKVPTDREDIKDVIKEIKEIAKEYDILESIDDYHISLSRVFPIREHHIDSLSKELITKLKYCKKFSINFSSLSTFLNDDASRLFISANVTLNVNKLNDCIKKIDNVLEEFKFPTFHEIPIPHLSVNWKSPNKDDKLLKEAIIEKPLKNISKPFMIDTIYWKIGKFEFFVNLINE